MLNRKLPLPVRGRRIHRYGACGRYLFEHHHAPLGAGDAPDTFALLLSQETASAAAAHTARAGTRRE